MMIRRNKNAKPEPYEQVYNYSLRLGDKAERIAKPIARGIDKVLHTDLENCGGCKKRKQWLNNLTKPKTQPKSNHGKS